MGQATHPTRAQTLATRSVADIGSVVLSRRQKHAEEVLIISASEAGRVALYGHATHMNDMHHRQSTE
jgi:ABC-type hemin transport system substrate-binding protein